MSVRRAEDRRGGGGRPDSPEKQWAAGGLPHRSPTTRSVGQPARLLCYSSVRSTTEIMDPAEGRVHGPGEPTCDRCGCNAKLRDPSSSGIWTKQIADSVERSLLFGRVAPNTQEVKGGLDCRRKLFSSLTRFGIEERATEIEDGLKMSRLPRRGMSCEPIGLVGYTADTQQSLR